MAERYEYKLRDVLAQARWGTIFECDGKVAVRHRVYEQDTKTACGQMLNFDQRKRTSHHTDHELSKEKRCKKCYPKR